MNEQRYVAPPSYPLLHSFARLGRDDSGQDLVEYALLAGALGVFAIASVHGLGNGLGNAYNHIVSSFNTAVVESH